MLFPRKDSREREVPPLNNVPGIVPERELPSVVNTFKLESKPIEEGIEPLRRLKFNISDVSAEREPIPEGMVPVRPTL